MKADLEAFITAAASRAFTWGELDCSLWVADWIVANGHPDPAAQLRGTYATEAACAALLADAGGLEALCTDQFTRIGLLPLTVPLAGAVGVIGGGRKRQWSAIWHRNRWLVFMGGGLVPFQARARAMWAV